VQYLESDFNAKICFSDVFGITVAPEQPVVDIEVVFSDLQANYIIKQLLHNSQERLRMKTEWLFSGTG
jgi:hypothetical protein